MNTIFLYPHPNQKPTKGYVNPVRFIEYILCGLCGAFALYNLLVPLWIYYVYAIVLIVIAGTFCILTVIDLLASCANKPIFWNIWMLFSTIGVYLFAFCVGLLRGERLEFSLMLFIGQFLNAVTAIVFLFDTFAIFKLLRRQKSVVAPEHQIISSSGDKPKEEIFEPTDNVIVVKTPSTIMVQPKSSDALRRKRPKITDSTSSTHSKRLCTSYGGTFPVAKNETPLPTPASYEETLPMTKETAPLPSPEPLVRQSSSRFPKRRSSTTLPTSKLQKGHDGKMYLADGTLLAEEYNDKGETVYKDPDGILYNINGIPIVSNDNKIIRIETRKIVSKKHVDRQPLRTCDSEMYTYDGVKVFKAQKTQDGKVKLPNGALLVAMIEPSGAKLYESSDGIPIGVLTETEISETFKEKLPGQVEISEIRKFEKQWEKLSSSSVTTASLVEEKDYSEEAKIRKYSDGKLCLKDELLLVAVKTASGRIVYESYDGELFTKDGAPVDTLSTPLDEKKERPSSIHSSYKLSLKDGEIVASQLSAVKYVDSNGGIVETIYSEEAKQKPHQEPNSRTSYSREGSKQILKEERKKSEVLSSVEVHQACDGLDTTIQMNYIPRKTSSKLQSDQDRTCRNQNDLSCFEQGEIIRSNRSSQVSHTKDVKQDIDTKIIKPRKRSDAEQVQSSTAQEVLKGGDGKLLYRNTNSPTNVTEIYSANLSHHEQLSLAQSLKPENEYENITDKYMVKSTYKGQNETGSRTVAISTRMVPKSPSLSKSSSYKSFSAPESPKTIKETVARPVKSAENAPTTNTVEYQHQQQPTSVYQQYHQTPCNCGQVHYPTAMNVHGIVSVTSPPPFYATHQVTNYCTPSSPCNLENCICCCRKKENEAVFREYSYGSERVPLNTICECEFETDSAVPDSTLDEMCHCSTYTRDYCGGRRFCTCSARRESQTQTSTGTSASQTSETRMIKASDVQKLNCHEKTNLPGTAD